MNWHEILLMAMKIYNLKTMRTITKQISSVAFLAFFLFACQKDLKYLEQGNPQMNPASVAAPADASAGYYIRFKSGQDETLYNYDTKAVLGEAGAASSLVIQGSAQADANKETIRLYLSFLSGSPAVGTYTQGDPSFRYLVSGSFKPRAEDQTYSAGLTPSTELPLTITITSIADGVMKGSFKGAFYKHDLSTGVLSSKEYINHTEGEFNLPVY